MPAPQKLARLLFAALAALPAPALAAPAPQEATKQACADASEEGQELRDTGKLRAAREKFLACAADVCPKFIRTDCEAWLADVDQRLPSIVIEARGPGERDRGDVRVLADGEMISEKLDGKAISLDPGEHLLRFEPQGSAPVEERVILREGEKRRAIAVRFAEPEKPKPPAPAPMAPSRSVPIASIALGGGALAGRQALAVLAASAKSDYDELSASCAPRCSPVLVEPVRQKLIAANVSIGLSAAALLAGAVIFITAPRGEPSAKITSFGVAPLPGGAAVLLTGPLPFD